MTKIIIARGARLTSSRAFNVGETRVLLLRDPSEEHLLDDHEHVDGAQDDADGGAHGLEAREPREEVRAEGPRDDHELADEAVRAREADAGEGRDDEEGRVDRHRRYFGEAAEVVELARVALVVDDAEEEKEHPRRDARWLTIWMHSAPIDAGVSAKSPSITAPEVGGDRRVRDEAFDVGLLPGAERHRWTSAS